MRVNNTTFLETISVLSSKKHPRTDVCLLPQFLVRKPAFHFYLGGRSILEPVPYLLLFFFVYFFLNSALYIFKYTRLVEKWFTTECVISEMEFGEVAACHRQRNLPANTPT